MINLLVERGQPVLWTSAYGGDWKMQIFHTNDISGTITLRLSRAISPRMSLFLVRTPRDQCA